MTNLHSNTLVLPILALGIAVASCSEQQIYPEPDNGEQLQLKLTRSSDPDTDNDPFEADIFIFRGESLVKTLYVSDTRSETVKIKDVGDGAIYVTSGHPLDVEEGLTTVEDITASIAWCGQESEGAPLFLSGSATLNDEIYASGHIAIDMVRSVARIDIVNVLDDNITVKEIVIEDAPEATYVFRHDEPVECGTTRHSHVFDEPFKGQAKGVLTLFESSKPVNIRIRGSYDGIPMDMTTSLPKVERNKVYTMQVVSVGAKVATTFTVKDWEEGSSVGAGSAAGSGLTIDTEHSVIPENVTVDYARNIVTVPCSGVTGMKLAFKSDTQIKLDKVDGLSSTTTVTENETETLTQGYVSSVTVDVLPQGKGRLGYSMTLHLRNALMSNSYDFVEIQVEPSPHQIETVVIGGHEWMCFNATSQDLEQQIYLADGAETVEQMYEQCFETCMGNYFQYLRPNPYSPFTGNDPNAVEKPGVTGWTQQEYMPLPEGYHIASLSEYQDLFPTTAMPCEYTCRAGERIRASIVTLPGYISTSVAAINNQNYLKRYILLESLDSGNKIIFPMTGLKNTNTSVTPANRFESTFSNWVADDRCVWYGVMGGSADDLSITISPNKYNYNGFMTVRGIKNAN